MLYPLRNEWQMEFAESAALALEKMSQIQFDVIVTDMRMPQMNGLELLEEVSKNYPSILRLILSGQADENMMLKSISPAHRYLSKPLDPIELKSTLDKILNLQDSLEYPEIKKIVSKITRIPSQPKLYNELIRELKSRDVDIKKVAKIISKDVSMTAEILRIVNSSYFGIRREIKNMDEAIMFLGINTIKAITFSIEVFSKFDQNKMKVLKISEVFDHCQKVSGFAAVLYQKVTGNKDQINDVILSGMLHDIGKIILAE